MAKKETKKNKNNFFIPRILLILLVGFLLRLVLIPFGTLELDHNTFIAWSEIVVKNGFANFYNGWSDYLPGYIYVLWFLGKLKEILPVSTVLLFKLPAIISDILTGFLIYQIVKEIKGKKWGLVASSLFLFNPAFLANSSLWGQIDSLIALFSLLTIWAFNKGKLTLSSVALAIGTLIKPQGAFAAPVILFLMIKNKTAFRKALFFVAFSSLVFVLGFAPFAGGRFLPQFILDRLNITLNQYQFTSVNAFNLWGITGMWKADTLTTQIAGIVILGIIFLIFTYKLYKKKYAEYILLPVTLIGNFLFITRMHERHLLPGIAALTPALAIEPLLAIPFIGFSLTYLANLHYSFVWITHNFREAFSSSFVKIISILNVNLLTLTGLISVFSPKLKLKFKPLKLFKSSDKPVKLPAVNISTKKLRIILLIIIIFSFASRVLFLGSPQKEYFDEVYHAFTARQMLHGNPKAWEWWNTPPEGYAYEWTHPPLAKLGMVTSMKIFGENSFGWRIPQAVLGVGIIVLTYLLAKEIFKDELVGILAAGVLSLDGLMLVMNRIGMNDSYFLFFALLAIFLFLKDKYLFSSLALGLSLSSKWSAVWAVPILLTMHFVFKKKLTFSYLWFLVVPILVYLGSYIPMFLSGHTWEQFIEVQRQMWWYHTNLKAEHPYTSPWYSWPFLIRPIWLYTSGVVSNAISNIYAMGNPAVFWMGIFSIAATLFLAVKERSKKLLFIVFSYAVFFAPWAASPRIMFMYHYLPSVPFLAIAIALLLRKRPKFIPVFFAVALVLFVYFYSHWTGINIPKSLDDSYYWFDTWK